MDKLKNTVNTLKGCYYSRKSSEGEDRQALSIPAQIEENFKLAQYHQLPEIKVNFSESKSAKEEGFRREFNEMFKKIDDGEINSIVCWKLDRLARNMIEGGKIMDYLSKGKIKAIFTSERVWLPEDNVLLMAVHFGQGAQFIKDLSDNVKRGQRIKAKMRGLPSGLASIGYKNSKQGEKGERWWFVDEERFWKVQKLLKEFATGRYSISKITRYAHEELKLTTPPHKKLGNRLITKEYLAKILHNPIVAGFFYVQGERYELDCNLPRMITEAEFNKIQLILSNRNKPKDHKHEAVYSGFIYSKHDYILAQDIKYQMWCDCRHKFAFRDKTHCPKCNKEIDSFDNPEYFIQQYYYDNRKKKAGMKYKSVREDSVTEQLIKYSDENFVTVSPLIDWAKKYINEIAEQETKDGLRKVEDIEKRKIQYEDKKKRAVRLFIEGSISEDEKKVFLNDIEKEYSDIKENNTPNINWIAKLNEITDLATCFKDVIEKGTNKEKRTTLTLLGSNKVWDEENLFISSKKSVDTFFSGLKMIKSNMEGFGKEKTLTEQGVSSYFDTNCISLRRTWDDVRLSLEEK